jgi:uncharacterized protein (UPF0332 family)
MDPRAILFVAKELRKTNGAAYYRSAVSRAYYSVLNVAAAMLVAMDGRSTTGDTHATVQRRLSATNDPVFQEISFRLGQFCHLRNRADYQMDDECNPTTRAVEDAIQEAEALIEKLIDCNPNSDRWLKAKAAIVKSGVG